jgi:BirA family biotin operon repressor/biotin-[acetyl-CoA-carboxylase] ligase
LAIEVQMPNCYSCGGSVFAINNGKLTLPWRLKIFSVCTSTETLLSNWLIDSPDLPIAVVAKKQRYGRGTGGRHWQSPRGGIWLSAAIPWNGDPPQAENLPIMMAAALAAELKILGLGPQLQLKPPNDLMVGDRKLAGVLTSILWRGSQVRLVRFGIGLNGRHPIRPPGITLEQVLDHHCPRWLKLIQLGLKAVERLALH